MSLSDYVSSFRDAWRDPKNRYDMIDAVRAVLKTVKPMIASLPEEKRAAVCAAAADRIRKTLGEVRKGGGSAGDYLGLAAKGRDRKAEEPNALGKRIMAKRNANMKVLQIKVKP